MAPEVMLGLEYGPSADIFSFGLILCELMTRCKISTFARAPQTGYVLPMAMVKSRVPTDPPPGLFELVEKCCDPAAANR